MATPRYSLILAKILAKKFNQAPPLVQASLPQALWSLRLAPDGMTAVAPQASSSVGNQGLSNALSASRAAKGRLLISGATPLRCYSFTVAPVLDAGGSPWACPPRPPRPQPLLSERRGSGQWTDAEFPFCARGFLVNQDRRTVNEHILQTGIATGGFQQTLKHTAGCPPSKAAELAAPLAKVIRQIPP